MSHTPTHVPTGRVRFQWRWFLTWTLVSSIFIFAALRILTGMTPTQPFLIQPFKDPYFGRFVMLILIAVTLVFCVYFLLFAALPGVGPHTSPAGRWLIAAMALVLSMTALFVTGAVTNQPDYSSALTPDRLLAFFREAQNISLDHNTLATALLISLTFALSAAAVISNLTTSLRGCSDEQNSTIRSFLLWMHATLTGIVAIYSVLLFKTVIRLPGYQDGFFMWYFVLFYLMITVLIFLIPAVRYGLFTTRTTLLTFTGINLPPWVSGFVSKTGLASSFPEFLKAIWEKF
jgi:predicted neutral ceramidase superfamily lipid hydrolase